MSEGIKKIKTCNLLFKKTSFLCVFLFSASYKKKKVRHTTIEADIKTRKCNWREKECVDC